MNNKELLKRWGHRLPQKNIPIFGALRIADGAYSAKIILEQNIDIEESPWWYDAVQQFTAKFLNDRNYTTGNIYDIVIRCICQQTGDKITFKINIINYTKIPKLEYSKCGN